MERMAEAAFRFAEKLLTEFPELAKEWEAMGIVDADPAKGNVPLPPTRSLMRAKTGREDGWWHRLYLEFAMERERRLYSEFAQRMRKLGYRNAIAGDAGGSGDNISSLKPIWMSATTSITLTPTTVTPARIFSLPLTTRSLCSQRS